MSQAPYYSGEGFADLHMHSFYSDGLLSPDAIVSYASGIGLRALAITDHDSVEGIEEAQRSGQRTGVEVIPGIELSTTLDGRDIHILGYCFDPNDEPLRKQLDLYRDERRVRAEKIVLKLNQLGIPIRLEAVLTKAGRGVIGRPHIADVLIENGFAKNIFEVFRDYLGQDGAAYEAKYKISPSFGVELLRNAGGVAVIAHPTLNMKETHVYDLIRNGVHGIECTHPKIDPSAASFYRRLVESHNLLETGGSDCHGRNTPPMIGQFKIPYALVEKMKDRAAVWQDSLRP